MMSARKQKFIGNLGHYLSQMLLKTLRIKICVDPAVDFQHQYIYGFWHNKHLVPIMVVQKLSGPKCAGLVSLSKDGEKLAVWLAKLGYKVIRGSSSRKAISGVVKLMAALKEGYCVGIAADGPRGPRYEAKAGIAFLALKSGLPMVPIGVAHSRRWQFNRSWDHYQIPKFFSKTVLYFGRPLVIEDISDIEAANARVAQAIESANQQAELLLRGKVANAQLADVKTWAKRQPSLKSNHAQYQP